MQKDGFPGRDSWEIAARGRPSLGCTLDVRQVRWNTAAVPQVAGLSEFMPNFLIDLHFCAGNFIDFCILAGMPAETVVVVCIMELR